MAITRYRALRAGTSLMEINETQTDSFQRHQYRFKRKLVVCAFEFD